MRKYYRYGEILLALRKEFQEYKCLLDELNRYIKVKDGDIHHTFGTLSYNICSSLDDKIIVMQDCRKIMLQVEKKYLEIMKKIRYVMNGTYSYELYKAQFMLRKDEYDSYYFKYFNYFNPIVKEKFIPEVEITDQEIFSSIVNKILASDLMQLQKAHFTNNNDSVILDFNEGLIHSYTRNGGDSFLQWDGISDEFNYDIEKIAEPSVIEELLSLCMPAYRISDEWLELLEKHEQDLDIDEFYVDRKILKRTGVLKLSEKQNDGRVKLMKKKRVRK